MSLLHQKLYQSGDIKSLNMSIYIREFVHYLTESFDVSNKILFRFDVDDVELSVTQAVPLALIMNEAVTNSIKYAFPGKQVGEIGISLKQWNHDDIEMEIADNGIGIAREIIDGNRSSLGIDLMMGLCEEIKGHIQFDNSKGTTVTIRFKKMMFNDTGALNVVEERAMVTA
jgi:two-component sensor histidine kinase